jgi:hypothetical protein
VAPWWSWYHKLSINLKFFFFFFNFKNFKGQGRKRAQGRPLVSEGRGTHLKMPRRNTTLLQYQYHGHVVQGERFYAFLWEFSHSINPKSVFKGKFTCHLHQTFHHAPSHLGTSYMYLIQYTVLAFDYVDALSIFFATLWIGSYELVNIWFFSSTLNIDLRLRRRRPLCHWSTSLYCKDDWKKTILSSSGRG